MPIEQICTIVSAEKLNEFAWSFTLEAGDLVKREGLRAGQFLHVKCGAEHLLRRPISVCLAQADEPVDLVRIVFEVRGEGTAWLSRRKAGDRLSVLAPLGNGFECGEKDRLLLVGGGIGVPPLLGVAAQLGEKAIAMLGFRNKDAVILEEDFQAAGAKTFIATDDGSYGHHGLVTDLCQEQDFDCVMACGPAPMLKAVTALAEQRGVPCYVSLEERMACGIGACLGCAVALNKEDGTQYFGHVCKDGPVFESHRVAW